VALLTIQIDKLTVVRQVEVGLGSADSSMTAIYKRCVALKLVVDRANADLLRIVTCNLSAEQRQGRNRRAGSVALLTIQIDKLTVVRQVEVGLGSADSSMTAIYKRCVALKLVVDRANADLLRIVTCNLSAEQRQNRFN
jgi:hypothetical protein